MPKKKIKLTEAQARETLQCLRSQAIRLKQLEAEMAAQQKALDQRFAPGIEDAQEHIKRYTKSLEEWAEANPDTFAGRKSLEWTDGTMGFRLGQPTLTKARTVSWETVLESVSDVLGDQFIRITSELDKRAIID